MDQDAEIKYIPFHYDRVNWEALRLDTILTHQLKVALNPNLFPRPVYDDFYNGPAFLSPESKKNLFLGFAAELKNIRSKAYAEEDDGEYRDPYAGRMSARAGGDDRESRDALDFFDFLELDSHLVTGGNFFRLKHPDSQKTYERQYSQAWKQTIRKRYYDYRKTAEFVKFISDGVDAGGELEW